MAEALFSRWGGSKPFFSREWHAGLAVLFLCVVAACFPTTPVWAAGPAGQRTLQGRLLFVKATGPVVKTAAKEYALVGRYHYISQTLGDKRLRNDEVRLKGQFLADGKFRVDDLYTIHHGELYRIRYFCETCNIAALGPGKCVCCQKPTELQEIPLNKDDKKILITR